MSQALRSVLAFVVVGLTLASGLFLGLATVMSAAAKGRDPFTGLESLARAVQTITESYVDEPDVADLIQHATAGLVSGLDAHTVWLDASEYAEMEARTDGDTGDDRGVSVEAIGEGLAYVRVEHFRRNVADEVDRRLAELETRGPLRAIVLDVRDDPGGLLEEAVAIVDLFASEGEIVSTRGRDGALVERHDATASPRDRTATLVVLVNERSASASEIVAGALQLLHRATVVGARSYGKGSVQQLFPLEDGSALKLTVARYALAGGARIEGVGVEPDRVVPFVDRAATASLRRDLETLPIDGAARDRLLSDVQALEAGLPLPGPPPVPWSGSFAERRRSDPQLEAAWAAIAP